MLKIKYLSIVFVVLSILSCFVKYGQSRNPFIDYERTLTDQERIKFTKQFIEHIHKYNKPYINSSNKWFYYYKYGAYDMKIQEQNNKFRNGESTWLAGHSRFTSEGKDYWDMFFKGYKVPNNHNLDTSKHQIYKYSKNSLNTLPTSIDWRAKGWVTNVKDQGECGSCWAFSTTGVLEAQHANVSGNLVSLSEENIVDCVSDCGGCGGGWPYMAEDYVVSNGGIDSESSYPYTAGGGVSTNCSFNSSNIVAKFSQVVKLPAGDADALYHAVATVGPVSVAIDAESDLMMYKSGIYTSSTCSKDQLDHAVLVVGYGITNTGQKYYIIKNSWGTSWGQDGYVYWDATDGNMCGIAQDATFAYAIPSSEPKPCYYKGEL